MSTKTNAIEQLLELLKAEDDSLLLTIPQAADKLEIAPNTVYKLIASGDLRAVDMTVPGAKRPKTRIRRDDLEAFIEARTREVRAS